MAKDKKSFVLYSDQKELFNQLSDEAAGKLIKHIFSYVNDDNPESEDMIINLAFTPIKQQLKRDLKKFEQIKKARSEAGKRGMKSRWSDNKNNKAKQKITKITDNENENENVINEEKTSNLDIYGYDSKP